MARSPADLVPPSYGTTFPVMIVTLGVGIAIPGYLQAIYGGRPDCFPGNAVHLWWNLRLTAALLALVALWALAVRQRWVSEATGVGLPLAGGAMAALHFCDLLVYLGSHSAFACGYPWIGRPDPPDIRFLGRVGLVFGLATTLAACLAERRLRTRGADAATSPAGDSPPDQA